MTDRVDFYVLKSAAPEVRWNFACRLTEKAYCRDLRIVVLHDTPADVELMDDLLWTFNQQSFVPHSVWKHDASSNAAPVQLTCDAAPITDIDLLVNLSGRLPDRLERFRRIAEVIDADEERRRLGRERFKAYRDLKVPLETHQLDDSGDL